MPGPLVQRHPLELVMDIMKYGADVEVLAPPELRTQVAERIRASLDLYGDLYGGPR